MKLTDVGGKLAVDVAALRALAARLPRQKANNARAMRDSDRY